MKKQTQFNCQYCHKIARLRCQACKNVYYCDKTCQQNHWIQHKDNCKFKYLHICLVDGSNVQEEIYQNYDIKFQTWKNVEIANLMDIPLKVKMFNKPKKDLNRNVAIYLLVDPDTGLANKNWIDFFKNGNGILGFGYSTYSAFRKMDFWNLYSFIYDLMDLYAEQQSHFIKEHKLTAKQFELHKQCIAKSDQVYLEKNKSINKTTKYIKI